MPFGSVKLVPGVNVEKTPTLLEAGYSATQLIRYKDGLAQKYGGWQKFYGLALGGVPRDMHAWQDLNATNHLLVGCTTSLNVLTSGVNIDITPQLLATNSAVNFTTVINTPTVTVIDANVGTLAVFDSVMIKTPVSVGGLLLWGVYQIQTVVGATSYTIKAAANATSSVSNGGSIPTFTTTNAASIVSVVMNNHGLTITTASTQTVTFQTSTTGNGVTISGTYPVLAVSDANTFTITASSQASSGGTFSMNSGNCQFQYYINNGPPPAGVGFGAGTFGAGGFGTGIVPSIQSGTPITTTDWTSDNWGKLALACPVGGAIYQYDPTGGFTNAINVVTAPPLNGGIFVSNSLQILFAWASTVYNDVGLAQDPMLIRWSDLTNYQSWTASTTNQAGSFRIPIGSRIVTACAAFNQNLFWTDLDMWVANYAGYPLVFGFNKVGSGAGAICSHAVQQLRSVIYWMGPTNFYSYAGSGVTVMPCPIWDVVFQNINRSYIQNVRAMPNTPFNEVGWLYPSTASVSGECDSYVKFNIQEGAWDYGTIARSAWLDQTVLGMPIGASPSAIVYQHETTPDADGTAINASFTTGYFYIDEGEEFSFVDQIIPDMKWGTYGNTGATVSITLNVTDYPGGVVRTYGPFTMTSSQTYITTRARGRQMSLTVQSSDIGSFWRLGKLRYRFRPDGRR